MKLTFTLTSVFFALAASAAWAQDGSTSQLSSGHINLDPTDILPKGVTDGSVDIRYFGGHEQLAYANLSHRWGIGNGNEGFVRGVLSSQKTTNAAIGGTISFGGFDFEAGTRHELMALSGIIGFVAVSVPQSVPEHGPILSMGATTNLISANGVTFELNPRAVFIRDNTIVGIGLGAKTTSNGRYSFSAEFTPVVAGDNTRDVTTGDKIRRNLYGAALHYRLTGGNVELSFGYTNSTGVTTGFGLTPGLGGSGALYIGLRGRY